MAAFTRTPTGVTNARTTPARRSVSPFTVDKDGHRYEADGAVALADKIASGRTVCR